MFKEKPTNYYGSELNKFIDQFCSRKMTCMNIDCLCVKVSKNRIRFVESKHSMEGFGEINKGQYDALKILDYILKQNQEWKSEVCILVGDLPYEKAVVYRIRDKCTKDYKDNFKVELTRQSLIKWLNFEVELEEAGGNK